MSELDRSERTRYDLGLLFTDGLPEHDDGTGYRGAVAARAAGISYRQLDYWARTELVEPTVRGAAGSGSQRLYGFRDILVLKLVKRLLDTGISLQQIRVAVTQLREAGIDDLAQTTLMSDGASVYLCTSDDEVIDLVRAMDFPLSKCKLVIATHADADHVQALANAKDRLKTKAAAHPKAAVALETGDVVQTYARIAAQDFDIPMPPCKIDVLLNEGDVVKVGKLKLDVWSTPGHTPGQLSFKMGNLLFSGDNIFKDASVGVIDAHHGSSIPGFIGSLRRILADDAEYLLPSHGPAFRKDPAILQQAIDRLTGYQHLADFGTCALSWPLQEQWEKDILAGEMPEL